MTRQILITGVSGTGKSSVCAALDRRGYTAYDIEERDGMFTMIDPVSGKPVDDWDPTDLDLVKRSEWRCDREQLAALLQESSAAYVFCCGVASNMDDILPLFDDVYLLDVEPDELRERLRTRDQPFGQEAHIRDWILDWKDWWDQEMQDQGATVIDADQPLEDVVDTILAEIGG